MSTVQEQGQVVRGSQNGADETRGGLVPVEAMPTMTQLAESELNPLMNKSQFDQMQRVAYAIGTGSLCPKHLQGKTAEQTSANCLRVVNQAARWNFDPFAVADESYVVHGKLGYQGKLVAAVVNARGKLKASLRPIYNAETGDEFAVVIFGSRSEIPAESFELLQDYADNESRQSLNRLGALGVMAVRLSVGQAKTDNEMWRKDPEQKLFYSGAIKWARRYCPEVIMGVLTDDDLERIAESRPAPQTFEVLSAKALEHEQASPQAPANGGGTNNPAPQASGADFTAPTGGAQAPVHPQRGAAQSPADARVATLQTALAEVQNSPDQAALKTLYDKYVGPTSTLHGDQCNLVSTACAARKAELEQQAAPPEQPAQTEGRDYEAELTAAGTHDERQAIIGVMAADGSVAADRLAAAKHQVELAKWKKPEGK